MRTFISLLFFVLFVLSAKGQQGSPVLKQWAGSASFGIMPGSENPNFDSKLGMNILLRLLYRLDTKQQIGFGLGQQTNYLNTSYNYYPLFVSYQKNWFYRPTFQTKFNVGYSVVANVQRLDGNLILEGKSNGGFFFNPMVGIKINNSDLFDLYFHTGVMHQRIEYEFSNEAAQYSLTEDWSLWRYIFAITIEI